MKKIFFLFAFLLSLNISSVIAQDKIKVTEQDYTNREVEMADALRADGKIYVVVAVITTIFVGLAAYLFVLDKRISRLEK